MRPPGVVLGVGWVAGLAAIRSLGRAGVRVLAVDDRASALGFRSRYAERHVAPARSGEVYVRFLHDLAAAGFVVADPEFPLSSGALPGPARSDAVDQAAEVSLSVIGHIAS